MKQIPGYLKAIFILIGLIAFFYALNVASSILIPLAVSLILAILILPIVKRLEKKFSRFISALLGVTIIILALGLLIYFFSMEIKNISENVDQLHEQVEDIKQQVASFLETRFGIDKNNQTEYLNKAFDNAVANSSEFLTKSLGAAAGAIGAFILIPIAIFFILYYRPYFVQFIKMAAPENQKENTLEMTISIKDVVQSYISGIFTVMTIIAFLDTTALLIIGIDYALFWGVLAALLTIIPYVGVFIGSSLPIAFAFLTTDSIWYPVAVFLSFWFIQMIEGNFITPNIVGDKVKINPFAIILAIFIGGKIWGPAGMILFVPFVAVVKVIFDHIEPLKPYGFLLGNPHPSESAGFLFNKIFGKKKKRA